jgi:hypothetical protein
MPAGNCKTQHIRTPPYACTPTFPKPFKLFYGQLLLQLLKEALQMQDKRLACRSAAAARAALHADWPCDEPTDLLAQLCCCGYLGLCCKRLLLINFCCTYCLLPVYPSAVTICYTCYLAHTHGADLA